MMLSEIEQLRCEVIDGLSRLIKHHGLVALGEECQPHYNVDTMDDIIKDNKAKYNTLRYTRDSLEDLFYRK